MSKKLTLGSLWGNVVVLKRDVADLSGIPSEAATFLNE